MAQLPSENVGQVWQSVMSEFSSLWSLIPISAPQVRSLLVLIDEELESAEIDILMALPPGDGRDWLIANPAIGRGLMLDVLGKRKEVL